MPASNSTRAVVDPEQIKKEIETVLDAAPAFGAVSVTFIFYGGALVRVERTRNESLKL